MPLRRRPGLQYSARSPEALTNPAIESMAFYDSGVTYDSGIHYDEAPPIPPKKRMAQSKLDLKARSDSELAAFSDAHVAAMTGNADFATPDPTAAAFATTLTAFKTALTASDQAQAAAQQKVAAKDAARVDVETALNARRNYVDTKSGGDEAKILSTGFAVRAAATPIGALPAPVDFLATFGDNPGEVDLVWSAIRGAKSYIVEVRENVAGTAWGGANVVTKSRATMEGLVTGKTYAFRVRAVGTAGNGPWSDESLKLAP